MRYPKLNVIHESRQTIDRFGGYNHNLRISENEFYEMQNMTSDHYPLLAPRAGRSLYTEATKANGLIAKDALCYVDGGNFVVNKYPVEMELNDEPKQLISMGAYVIILPDKKYINTENLSDFGDIEVVNTSTEAVTIGMCKADGTDYGEIPASPTEPGDPENGDLWIDTSTTPHSLKQYSSTSSLMWVSVATTYVRIYSPGIGIGINKYDGVTISGMNDESLNGSFIVQDAGADYVTVIALVDKTTTQSEPVTISRLMPSMDYVTECGNRLWGCRYGLSADGQVVNEIYACKLGDFKNWECYMGISTDSWRGSVGTDGAFTGAITHMGYPVFFKENCLHKVYISSVGAHQVQDTACRGVQRGCDKSLAIVNETLYYKSRTGIMAYDGALPVETSYVLGEKSYHDVVAGANGNKYYACMIDDEDKANIFVYDTAKGLWHREDDLFVSQFCSCRGALYAITDDRTKVICMTGGDEVVEWMVQSGEIGLTTPEMKYISRLTMRMSLAQGSEVRVYAQYDHQHDWDLVLYMKGTSLRSFSVPIRPKRCDYMRFKIEGIGDAKIYSETKTMRKGSELS